MAFFLLIILATSANVTVETGTATSIPQGYTVSNLDPAFNSSLNSQIYDPNFLPGFNAGLSNTTIDWSSGKGYAALGYHVGPWTHQESSGIPHLAVGPQCCNFQEVQHTQQFRKIDWGDYYSVNAGFGPPGVNVENYTTNFSSPAYVGLRTDWDWKVQISLDWTQPLMMDPSNGWGAIGISVTQFVPNAPGNLVSTLVNLWMDSNSSKYVPFSTDTSQKTVGANLVVYHSGQISKLGNTTITLDLSPYLQDTLNSLGFHTMPKQPPVISSVYLNVAGYNFEWDTTLWSFNVVTQQVGNLQSNCSQDWPVRVLPASLLLVSTISISFFLKRNSSAQEKKDHIMVRLSCRRFLVANFHRILELREKTNG